MWRNNGRQYRRYRELNFLIQLIPATARKNFPYQIKQGVSSVNKEIGTQKKADYILMCARIYNQKKGYDQIAA